LSLGKGRIRQPLHPKLGCSWNATEFTNKSCVALKKVFLPVGSIPRIWSVASLAYGIAPTRPELTEHMADFKEYMRIDYTPGGWYRSDPATE
jgi:hypothetical protein